MQHLSVWQFAKHRSDCSQTWAPRGQVTVAQARLFKALKNQVWLPDKTPFYLDPNPLHWTYCLLFCKLTMRECLLTTVNRTKAKGWPRAGAKTDKTGRSGAPEGIRCGSMTGPKKEQSKAKKERKKKKKSMGVIMDSHIRSIKVWWEMGYGSSLAR